MEPTEYSIEDLSTLTGFSRRSIRNYVQQYLVPAPHTVGRNARYGEQHLRRLLLIRELRERRHMSLAEIRSTLLFSTEEELDSLATMPISERPAQVETPKADTALEYLERLGAPRPDNENPSASDRLSMNVAMDQESAPSSPPGPSQRQRKPASPVERLLGRMEEVTVWGPTKRRAKGESWVRIPVTPDMEISVRGVRSKEELARLEAIADRFREILMEESDE